MIEFKYDYINQILEWDQIHNYVFDNGLKALETISNIVGYKKEPFIQGSAFENLIRDNPEIVEHIFNYLEEHFQDKLTDTY